MTHAIPDFLVLTPSLAAKLAAIAVHADEMLSPHAHAFDKVALGVSCRDPEVLDWLVRCGPLAPVARS